MMRCRKLLEDGLQAMNVDYSASQVDALLDFLALLIKWNRAYNLTAIRDPEDMVRLHLLDSLTVLPYLKGNAVADVGTGAGLPGIPLAIFAPQCAFMLLDSNAKKTRFIQQVILELKLPNVIVKHVRVEQFSPTEKFSTVIMRAFADTPKIIALTRHLLAKGGVLLAMKGHAPEQELQHLAQSWRLIPLKVPGVEAERCLVCIEGQNNG
ncbi:16S rRNA (guanine(527)-N(7))-methyltransferase RsmG [methane-oxidizing endosymbiont of Gigantopelta aegis]|uniref:16S rRNA (guanine(527)-N(7))-methyltransferase RsmG n=1 Tax=methane-oxidizing endosymbiont of Gigantopelta aegis TaxID=2794938 RepID=UPI0018DC1AA1|nr:16S rRNA (guanine(527)-N(7))-methyltransferase RsmG [methane-oxidizing endosymbiont of Gigantopelta aegis]